MAIIGVAPILVILILMIGFRWGATRAGSFGYLTAIIIAIIIFGAGMEVLAIAHVRAIILALDVILIIWGALLLYHVVYESGAIKTLGKLLPSLTNDRGWQAILIGWVFASFLQGAGGFGVPVAVTAPILIGLGFTPLTAIIIPSIGHGWAVTFGSFGSSFNALLNVSGLDASALGQKSAFFLGAACLITGPMVSYASAGWRGVKRLLFPVLCIGFTMGAVQYFTVVVLEMWNLGAFMGGVAGIAVSVGIIRWQAASTGLERSDRRPLLTALSGYLVLILLSVTILLIPLINNWLGQISLAIQYPKTVTSFGYVFPGGTNRPIQVFTHPGLILIYTSIISYFIYLRAGLLNSNAIKRILDKTLVGIKSPSLSIILMITMAVIMQQSGITEALALGLANVASNVYPLTAAWIGAFGAFMTGSNTNSNVVFAALQMRTAEILSISVPIILAGQTAGASLASIAAPAKILVGASTAGIAGKEGEVLRTLIGYSAIFVLFICVLTWIANLLAT